VRRRFKTALLGTAAAAAVIAAVYAIVTIVAPIVCFLKPGCVL
jgi:hypothetical protein